MKRWIIALLIVAIAGTVALVAYLHRTPPMIFLPNGAVIYDVRSSDDYARNHVVTAKSLPLTSLQQGKLPAVPKSTTIAIYGTSAQISSQAAAILKKAGFTTIIDMHDLAGTANYGLSIVQ